MKKAVVSFLLFFSVMMPLEAKMIAEKRNGALWIKSATTAEVEETFKQYGFDDFTKVYSKFPRIYLSKLPTDWKDVADSDDKHRTFIRILLPLVLKINEQILTERQEIEKIEAKYTQGKKLTDKDLALLEKKAEKYDVFTRLKEEERTPYLLKKLLEKIDVVPPSLMISTAGIYTDWGTSRLALQANALYLDEVWYDNHGLRPKDDENADYRYKIYASLEECMTARALKLNSHINYDYFREARRISRTMKRPPYGPQLAAKMLKDSNLQNIAGLIDYTFSFYKLTRTDFFPELEDIK